MNDTTTLRLRPDLEVIGRFPTVPAGGLYGYQVATNPEAQRPVRSWFGCRYCGTTFVGGIGQPVHEEKASCFAHEAICADRPTTNVITDDVTRDALEDVYGTLIRREMSRLAAALHNRPHDRELRAHHQMMIAELARLGLPYDLGTYSNPALPAGPPTRPPVPSHLDPQDSGGLVGMPPLTNGPGSLYELAVVESPTIHPHLWLVVTDELGRDVRVHVPAETAWKYAEQIITAVRNHHAGDCTPASAAYQVTPLWTTPSEES